MKLDSFKTVLKCKKCVCKATSF